MNDDIRAALQRWQEIINNADEWLTFARDCKSLQDEEFRNIEPVLDADSTQKQCLEAVAKLHVDCSNAISGLLPMYNTLVVKTSGLIEHITRLSDIRETRTETPDLRTIRQQAVGKKSELESALETFKLQWHRTTLSLFQTKMHGLLVNQNEEIRRQLLDFAQQLTESHVPKEEVQVTPLADEFILPPEIMPLIYEFADLETCVALRQVNTKWYDLYQQMDDVFAEKMPVRNPWMKPQDGIERWTDVVLVFVQRLQNWKKTHYVEKFSFAEPAQLPKVLVGEELGFERRLSPDFVSIFDNVACASASEHFSTVKDYHEYLMSPWTKEVTRHSLDHEVVSEDTSTIIKYKGVTITLPAYFLSEDTRVDMYSKHIAVLSDGHWVIMSRDQPTYKEGIVFTLPAGHIYTAFEAGDVFCIQNGHAVGGPKGIITYFADLHSKKMHEMFGYHDTQPVAFYNGLVWWAVRDVIVPTMVDLQDTDSAYCNPRKNLSAKIDGIARQGSRSRDAAHLLVSQSSTGLHIFNLASGTPTFVTRPCSWPESERYFLGFEHGRFRARCVHHSTVHAWRWVMFDRFDDLPEQAVAWLNDEEGDEEGEEDDDEDEEDEEVVVTAEGGEEVVTVDILPEDGN